MRYIDAQHEARRRKMLEARAAARGGGVKAAQGPTQNKAASGPTENKTAATPAVTFASPQAAKVAEDLGVDVAKLAETKPSGANGYTVADVRRAAG